MSGDADFLEWDGEVEAEFAADLARMEAEDEHREVCPRCGGPLVDPTPDGGDHHGADHDICGPCWQTKADRTYDRLREREWE